MLNSSIFKNDILQGKVAVVTGAARGIGRAAAVALASAGADIVGIDLCAVIDPHAGVIPATQEDLQETGRQVQAIGRKWMQFILDQRSTAALKETVSQIESTLGGVNIVFANASIQSFVPLLEMQDADWNITIDNNLTGSANVLRTYAPLLVKRGGGSIILTTSTQGQHGTLNAAAYSASKWGIIGLMKSAALELGKHNITVNALVPGLIDTALTRHEERYAQQLEKTGKQPSGDVAADEKAAKEGLQKTNPLGVPWINPDALGPIVVLLASEAGRMMSGAQYAVTAGDSANTTS